MPKIQRLAYIAAASTDFEKWKAHAEQFLGMQAISQADGGLHLKMDKRPFRFAIEKGPEDRYLISGWEVDSDAEFEGVLAAVKAAGVDVQLLDADAAAKRCTKRLAQFKDPAGNLLELCVGNTGAHEKAVSPIPDHAGFLTGNLGLGHTVLPALPFDDTLAFYRDVLGFGLSDEFHFQPGPDAPVMRIYFMHAGCGRHHSIALAEMPHPAACVHVMVEVNSMTEVGLAHDRATAQGLKFMATLGEHENDRMTSFYVMTPGGFALEYGYGGIQVDPASWQTTQTKRVSIWGHDFSVGFQE